MTITTISSRQLNQDAGRAKKLAKARLPTEETRASPDSVNTVLSFSSPAPIGPKLLARHSKREPVHFTLSKGLEASTASA